MKQYHYFSFRFSVILAVAFTIISVSCVGKVSNIKIVIPVGFKGLIQIVEMPNTGRRLLQAENGFVIEIPDTGMVSVESIGLFEQPFKVQSCYDDGRSINVGTPPDDKKLKGQVFWLIKQPVTRRVYFFVGSWEELVDYNFDSPNIYSPDLD